MGNKIVERVPRNKRTPITDAGESLNVAWEFWVDVVTKLMAEDPSHDFGEIANPEKYFASKIFGEAWNNPETNGDKSVDEIGLSTDGKRDPDHAPFALLEVMVTIVAYSVQAMKAEKGDRHEEAWTYAADALYWAGILKAAWAEKNYGANPATEMAKRRHAENYALAADAIKYWREKIDPNLSASKQPMNCLA